MKKAKLSELRDALVKLCESHVEIANSEVLIASECGYADAFIASPVILYRYIDGIDRIHILTDDDRDIDNINNIVKYTAREE